MTEPQATIAQVIKLHGKPPSKEWLAKYIKITEQQAEKELADYAKTIEKPVEVQKTTDKIHELPIKTIKILAVALAVIAFVRAMFYAFGWFHNGDDYILSWLMSTLVVGMTTLVPMLGVMLYRGKKYWLATGTFTLAVVIMVFSMAMTVAGIYNDRTVKTQTQDAKLQAELKSRGIYSDLIKQEGILTGEYNEASALSKKLNADLLKSTDKNYWSIKWQADQATKKTEKIRDQLTAIIAQKKDQNFSTAPRLDFIDWLSSTLGWSRDLVELILAIIPALIIDLVAPILLYVVVFL